MVLYYFSMQDRLGYGVFDGEGWDGDYGGGIGLLEGVYFVV